MRFRPAVAVVLVGVLLLSGCWSRRELTEVSFASVIGVDWQEGRFLITVAITSPRPQVGEQSGGASRPRVWTISERAPSPDAALAKIDQVLERSLTLSHVRSVIFGEAMARRGIGPAMDFLLRSVEIRPTAWIGVTNGMASELLEARPKQDVLTEGPLGYHDSAQQRSSISPARRLTQVANILQEEGIDLTLPLFRRGHEEAPDAEAAEEEGALRGKPEHREEIVYGGAGVFRGDKLVAWMTPEETRGHVWGIDRIVHGAVSAQCPNPDPDSRIVFRLRKGTGESLPRVENGKLRGTVRVKVIADVNDITCDQPVSHENDMAKLRKLLADRVRENIQEALAIARESGADIFGFGQNLYRHNPRAFRMLQSKWPDQLKELPVAIQIDARVGRMGQINNRYQWERAE